jgi:hypothetical protein
MSVYPHTLVMHKFNCDYCNSIEDINEKIIFYLFGIYYCKNHEQNAINDCNDYMKKTGIIQINNIPKTYTKLKKFINYIINKKFAVLRSDKKLEENWNISQNYELENFVQIIHYMPHKNQCYPWFINASNGYLTKWITLYSIVEYLSHTGDKNIMNYYNNALPEMESMVEIN